LNFLQLIKAFSKIFVFRKNKTKFQRTLHYHLILRNVGFSLNYMLLLLIHSFINSYTALLLCPSVFFGFVNLFTQTVWLLGRAISPSQGRYLHKRQHKHRKNAHTDTHAFEWDLNPRSQRSSGDSSCLRPGGHRDRPLLLIVTKISTQLYHEAQLIYITVGYSTTLPAHKLFSV
jgi:hypothetical protein